MLNKICLIGYGNIARKHIEVFRALGCEIVASCNRNEAHNRLAIKESCIPKTFTSYHEMIRSVKPDGILVCVSFWNNYQVLKDIIPYGIPILVEKPSGTSLAEHLDLIKWAAQHKTPVMMGLNRRHYSVLNKALDACGGRKNITSVLVEWSEEPLRLLDQKSYTEEQVAKVLFGNSIHGLDMLTYIAGEVKKPQISVRDFGRRFRWLMNLSGIAEQGAVVNFNSNWDNFIPWRVMFTAPGKHFLMAPLETCTMFEGKNREPVFLTPSKEDEQFKAGFYVQADLFRRLAFQENEFGLPSATHSMQLAELLFQKIYHAKKSIVEEICPVVA